MRLQILTTIIALQCGMAQAQTIASLTLDWNGDGYQDIARLDHSAQVAGRADLLLFEGDTAGPGSKLVQVAQDFARVPSHPNMDLQIVAGSDTNRFDVIETGIAVDPAFWWAKTDLRHSDGVFFVDRYNMRQTDPIFQDGGEYECVIDFVNNIIGGGDDVNADAGPVDTDPMPLVYWTSATIPHLAGQKVPGGCAPYPASYDSFKNSGNTIADELTVDWNNDGYTDQLVLFDIYSSPSLLIYMGDNLGGQDLYWIGRDLGLPRGADTRLRLLPGQQGRIEVTVFGEPVDDGFKKDTATLISWQNDAPVITGFSVWQSHDPNRPGIDCAWNFERGQQINVYSDAWFDDPAFASTYSLDAWNSTIMDTIISNCRP